MKSKIVVFVLVVLSLTLSACGGALTQGKQDVVKIGWTGGPDSLNPGAAWLAKAYTIFELVYDLMYEVNLDGTYCERIGRKCRTFG